jgi:hypothetical protein
VILLILRLKNGKSLSLTRFSPLEVADQIKQLSIPPLSFEQKKKKKKIPPLSQEDRLVWTETPNGCFTTSNAYKLQAENKQNEEGSSSNPRRLSTFWKGLWRAGAGSRNSI